MKCFVCSQELKVYDRLRFIVVDEPELIKPDLYVCDCGFGFYRHNQIARLYKENNKYITNNTGSGAAPKFDMMRLTNSYNNIVPYLREDCRLLDVGCNNGTFLNILYDHGYRNLTGTDFAINRAYTASLEERGVSIHQSFSLKEINAPELFDFITINHVLEHVDNIEVFIDEVCTVLTNDGMLYIEVPDASGYMDKYFQPFSYFDLEHINHFSINNLTMLLNRKGFKVLETFSFDIFMSDNIRYPGIGIAAKRSEGSVHTETNNSMNLSKQKVQQYYDRSLAEISNYKYDGSLDNVVLYGVGANTLRTLAMLDKDINGAKYFVDRNELFYGRYVLDKEIKSVDDLCNDSSTPDILIFSKLYYDEIVADLQKRGVINKIHSFF